jgi:hypothetical protein
MADGLFTFNGSKVKINNTMPCRQHFYSQYGMAFFH